MDDPDIIDDFLSVFGVWINKLEDFILSRTMMSDATRGLAKWGDVEVGDFVDVLDDLEEWCEAKVTRVDRAKGAVLVKYLYWVNLWESQWIFDVDERVAPLHSQSTFHGDSLIRSCPKVLIRSLSSSGDCDAVDTTTWREGIIITESSDKVKVRFLPRNQGHPDQWIRRDSDLIRPYTASPASSDNSNLESDHSTAYSTATATSNPAAFTGGSVPITGARGQRATSPLRQRIQPKKKEKTAPAKYFRAWSGDDGKLLSLASLLSLGASYAGCAASEYCCSFLGTPSSFLTDACVEDTVSSATPTATASSTIKVATARDTSSTANRHSDVADGPPYSGSEYSYFPSSFDFDDTIFDPVIVSEASATTSTSTSTLTTSVASTSSFISAPASFSSEFLLPQEQGHSGITISSSSPELHGDRLLSACEEGDGPTSAAYLHYPGHNSPFSIAPASERPDAPNKKSYGTFAHSHSHSPSHSYSYGRSHSDSSLDMVEKARLGDSHDGREVPECIECEEWPKWATKIEDEKPKWYGSKRRRAANTSNSRRSDGRIENTSDDEVNAADEDDGDGDGCGHDSWCAGSFDSIIVNPMHRYLSDQHQLVPSPPSQPQPRQSQGVNDGKSTSGAAQAKAETEVEAEAEAEAEAPMELQEEPTATIPRDQSLASVTGGSDNEGNCADLTNVEVERKVKDRGAGLAWNFDWILTVINPQYPDDDDIHDDANADAPFAQHSISSVPTSPRITDNDVGGESECISTDGDDNRQCRFVANGDDNTGDGFVASGDVSRISVVNGDDELFQSSVGSNDLRVVVDSADMVPETGNTDGATVCGEVTENDIAAAAPAAANYIISGHTHARASDFNAWDCHSRNISSIRAFTTATTTGFSRGSVNYNGIGSGGLVAANTDALLSPLFDCCIDDELAWFENSLDDILDRRCSRTTSTSTSTSTSCTTSVEQDCTVDDALSEMEKGEGGSSGGRQNQAADVTSEVEKEVVGLAVVGGIFNTESEHGHSIGVPIGCTEPCSDEGVTSEYESDFEEVFEVVSTFSADDGYSTDTDYVIVDGSSM